MHTFNQTTSKKRNGCCFLQYTTHAAKSIPKDAVGNGSDEGISKLFYSTDPGIQVPVSAVVASPDDIPVTGSESPLMSHRSSGSDDQHRTDWQLLGSKASSRPQSHSKSQSKRVFWKGRNLERKHRPSSVWNISRHVSHSSISKRRRMECSQKQWYVFVVLWCVVHDF